MKRLKITLMSDTRAHTQIVPASKGTLSYGEGTTKINPVSSVFLICTEYQSSSEKGRVSGASPNP